LVRAQQPALQKGRDTMNPRKKSRGLGAALHDASRVAIAVLGKRATGLQPSLTITPPFSTASLTKVVRLSLDPSAIRFRRMRPIPLPRISAAMTTIALFPRCRRPPPFSTPPTHVSCWIPLRHPPARARACD
jgi:hypothetical protein